MAFLRVSSAVSVVRCRLERRFRTARWSRRPSRPASPGWGAAAPLRRRRRRPRRRPWRRGPGGRRSCAGAAWVWCDQLRGHVLELQRGDGAAQVLHRVDAARRFTSACCGVACSRRVELLGGAVEVAHQRVAGVGQQALQAVEVVAGHHQVVLQVGRGQQRQRRGGWSASASIGESSASWRRGRVSVGRRAPRGPRAMQAFSAGPGDIEGDLGSDAAANCRRRAHRAYVGARAARYVSATGTPAADAPLRVLHLEDSELDHELALAHLRRGGLRRADAARRHRGRVPRRARASTGT